MTKNPVLKRVRFTFEALCHTDMNAESMDLADVLRECDDGEMSGLAVGSPEVKLLDLRQAKLACAVHGSDPEFFQLPEFDIGTRVYWTDPDAGACSGWYTIRAWTGEFYQMTNAAGGECEAFWHELSLKKPKGKK